MKHRNFKSNSKIFFFLLSFTFLLSVTSSAQTTELSIDLNCTNAITVSLCPTFANVTCSNPPGWTSSNGTPQLLFWRTFKGQTQYKALMISNSTATEGMFKPYVFIQGETYDINVDFSSTGGQSVSSPKNSTF